MTVRFKPLTIDVSVHGAFGVWSWAALTSRFIARDVRHRDEHLYCNAPRSQRNRAQYEVQCRITQLDSGRPARRRQTAYVTTL